MISRQDLIGEVVARYPQSADVMLSYGLHCIGCQVSPYETIEQGAMGHGMESEKVDALIAELNKKFAKTAVLTGSDKELEFTKPAAKKVKQLMKAEGKSGFGLRISLSPGGCAGYSYEMNFEEKPTDKDVTLSQNGLKIFFEKTFEDQLKGTVIDYSESLNNPGFKIRNPNAKSSCGCGKSSGF